MSRPFSHPAIRVACCVFLLALPLTTAWNLAVASSHPKLEIKIGPKLAGVTRLLPLEWSMASLTDGSLQKAITQRVTEALPIRPLLVRLNNELRFELFGELNLPGVIRGAGGQLIEQSYFDEYCNRTESLAEARAASSLPKIKTIQDYYRSRGAVFIYLISPSKVAHMPEHFLTGAPCPSSARARAQFIPRYTALLKQTGINVLDLASFIHGLKGTYDIDLFPQGGSHWNDIGGARATALIVEEINRQAGKPLAPPYSFTYTISSATAGVDRELADLLNTIFPTMAYLTPKVNFQPSASCATHPSRSLDVAFVGSSFSHLPAEILARENCLNGLNTYFYLTGGRFGGTPYRKIQADLTENDLDRLRNAEIFILEENESFVGTSTYISRLSEIVSKTP